MTFHKLNTLIWPKNRKEKDWETIGIGTLAKIRAQRKHTHGSCQCLPCGDKGGVCVLSRTLQKGLEWWQGDGQIKGDRTKRDVSITEVDILAVAKQGRDNEYRINWVQHSGRNPGLKVSLHKKEASWCWERLRDKPTTKPRALLSHCCPF